MSNKLQTMRAHLTKTMVSIFILIIVLGPLYLTGTWLHAVMFGNDPRKVTGSSAFSARAVDKSTIPLRPFKEPLLTVTFDDGWESIYSEAYPLLQKYGIPTTQYILGGVFDDYAYMSVSQLHSMQKNGHEIASHTLTHPDLTTLDNEDLDWELKESQRLLAKEFGDIKDFASPLGAFDTRTQAAINTYYRSHRNTAADPASVDDKDVNTAANFDIHNIIAYTIRRTTTLQDLQALLDYTGQNNGWLVITYHQVEDATLDYGVTPEELEQQLKLIHAAKMRTATVGNVLDIITSQGYRK